MRLEWQHHTWDLLPERALFERHSKTLFIADPHFGKAHTFQDAGIPIPEGAASRDCDRLSRAIEKSGARDLVILGDFLHAAAGRTPQIRDILLEWRRRYSNIHIRLIMGNHDLRAGVPWKNSISRFTRLHGPGAVFYVPTNHMNVQHCLSWLGTFTPATGFEQRTGPLFSCHASG